MSITRRAYAAITYEHANITDDIRRDLKSFSFTDCASGESDRISISVQDREKKWMGGWMPQKGDHISADAEFKNWSGDGDNWEIYCGEFQVDDISVSGPPAQCSIGAVSIPRSEAFNETERTKNWEEVTVQEVAQEIAARAGISLFYEADEIQIRSMEQDKQTDCKFLYSVCEKYGLAMKVFAERIVIFDEAQYEAAEPVGNIGYEECSQYAYNESLEGTYTGAKISYCDPGDAEDHIVMVGGGERILEINEEADSAADAQRKAVASLNNKNKKAATMNCTIMSKKNVEASRCVTVSGFGKPDGTYYIEKVITKIGAGGASAQTLSMHKVGYRMDDAVVTVDEIPQETDVGNGTNYIVVKGDTLWSIAKQFLGSALRYAEIYNENKDIIEETAKGRGKRDSSNGHWIFPGTALIISAGRSINGKRNTKRKGIRDKL